LEDTVYAEISAYGRPEESRYLAGMYAEMSMQNDLLKEVLGKK